MFKVWASNWFRKSLLIFFSSSRFFFSKTLSSKWKPQTLKCFQSNCLWTICEKNSLPQPVAGCSPPGSRLNLLAKLVLTDWLWMILKIKKSSVFHRSSWIPFYWKVFNKVVTILFFNFNEVERRQYSIADQWWLATNQGESLIFIIPFKRLQTFQFNLCLCICVSRSDTSEDHRKCSFNELRWAH